MLCAQLGVQRDTKSPFPGPGTYPAPSSVGRQANSRLRSMGGATMGAASRDQVVKTVAPDAPFAVSDQTPGPGSYSLPPPRQRRAKGFSVSLWYPAPRWNHHGLRCAFCQFQFGASTRANVSKTYTSCAFAQGMGNINTSSDLASRPGPGHYDGVASIGSGGDPRYKARCVYVGVSMVGCKAHRVYTRGCAGITKVQLR